jgi:CRISPR/Cas system CMR subunit Cmr6 (Cas7 group RAMP superfamily)
MSTWNSKLSRGRVNRFAISRLSLNESKDAPIIINDESKNIPDSIASSDMKILMSTTSTQERGNHLIEILKKKQKRQDRLAELAELNNDNTKDEVNPNIEPSPNPALKKKSRRVVSHQQTKGFILEYHLVLERLKKIPLIGGSHQLSLEVYSNKYYYNLIIFRENTLLFVLCSSIF